MNTDSDLRELIVKVGLLAADQRERVVAALAAAVSRSSAQSIPGASRPDCPHCGADRPVRAGHVRGQQRWRCRSCKRTFGEMAGTLLVGLHHKSEWVRFEQAMAEGLPMAEAAERCGIHRDTAQRWRRRLLNEPRSAAPARAIENRENPDSQFRQEQGNPADARVRRTRQSLHRAMLSLIGRKQFEQVTIREVAAEAGIGYATFFRRYASTKDLLNEIAEEQIRRLMGLAFPLLEENGSSARLSPTLTLCKHIDQNRQLWSLLLGGGAASALRSELIRLSLEYGRIRFSDWLPSTLGAVFGVSGTIEILSWWLQSPDQYTAAQIAGILDRLVVAPLMAGSSRRT